MGAGLDIDPADFLALDLLENQREVSDSGLFDAALNGVRLRNVVALEPCSQGNI
jgi:hypothetical protein